MHVYRTRSSKRTRIYSLVRAGGGACVYEIKTLHSNSALEEGGGRLFEGAYNRASTVVAECRVHVDRTGMEICSADCAYANNWIVH